MGDLQKKLFQSKLRQAEASLGLSFAEDDDSLVASREERSSDPRLSTKESDPHSWKEFFKVNRRVVRDDGDCFNTYYTPPLNDDAPIFIFHHGAGSSGLSFGLLARAIVEYMASSDAESKESIAGVFSFDARGHGKTNIVNNPEDYSLDKFVADAIFLIRDLVSHNGIKNNSLFLVGHSLGGSILTNAIPQLNDLNIKGLAMFDIVEETAIRALDGMDSYLLGLPKGFKSIKEAIDWHLRIGLLRNKESASVSVPSYLQLDQESGRYKWITDLEKTKPYWNTWFLGLSKCFVDAPTSKLLILAGTDNLDKELMVGQMQGKYQLVVFQDSGHFIQEDVPKKTAITLIEFWKRNDKSQTVIKSTWGGKK